MGTDKLHQAEIVDKLTTLALDASGEVLFVFGLVAITFGGLRLGWEKLRERERPVAH